MQRLRHIFIVLSALSALSAIAADPAPQGQDVWDFDSIAAPRPAITASQVTAKQIYDMLAAMIEKWNAHDLDGYLDYVWHSPAFVLIEDGAAINGWQELSDKYHRSFADSNNMGHSNLARVQIRMLGPDTAFAISSWTVGFPRTKRLVVGTDSNYVQRIGGAWKITLSHSSQLEM
jgi:hypothetical protein